MSGPPTRATAGQLALELPLELPPIALAPEWKDQQRLWGHAFHPMCSYLASFPAALTHAFIARYSRPGDVVLDPFSGRGTTPLQACAEGRIGVGNDLNPFAHLLTAAKVEPATRAAGGDPPGRSSGSAGTRTRAAGWPSASASRRDPGAATSLVPAAGSGTARRRRRRARPGRGRARVPPADARPAAVRPDRRSASTTGPTASWPPRSPGSSTARARSYLSELMPNTFSMAPRYVRDFAARTAFASPERDVFDGLAKKLDRLFRQPPPSIEGIALLGDARDVAPRARAALRARGRPERARLVVTSPPYLRVVKYGYYNWLRTWFLGFDARAIDATLDDAHHREPYLAVPARRPRRPPAGPRRRRRRRPGHRRRRDRPRPATSGAASASPSGPGSAAAEPEGYRLAGVALDDVAAAAR